MADFRTSTHRARWIFTPHELGEKYRAANQRAIEALDKYGATRVEVDIDGTLTYPEPLSGVRGDKHSRAKPLNVDEEKLLRAFYEYKIQDACQAFNFPHKIQATALLYFKRFYLQWSVMQHYPKNIMLTCIYAACKIEENHVSAEELGKGISQDHQMILNNEMIVYQAWICVNSLCHKFRILFVIFLKPSCDLQSIDFDLIVYAPYRSVEGFVDDMEVFYQADNGQLQKLEDLKNTAKAEVDKSMLTEAPLLFPPGQLALAALRRSNNLHRVVDFESYLTRILARQNFAHTLSELMEALDAIDIWTAKHYIPTAEELKRIDRKVKSCLDPSSHDKSKKREKKSKHKSKQGSEDVTPGGE
ncbi:unnamed protein product [Rhodiola kirilowii]